MRCRIKLTLWDSVAVVSVTVGGCLALVYSSDALAHVLVTGEAVLAAVVIAFLTSISGGPRRFLGAFLTTIVIYEILAQTVYSQPLKIPFGQIALLLKGPTLSLSHEAIEGVVGAVVLGTFAGIAAKALQPPMPARSVEKTG